MPTRDIETNVGVTPLEILGSQSYPRIIGAVVKDGFSVSRGDVLGKITTGGLLRRRPVSTVGSTPFGTGSAAGSVADGSLFKVGDVLKAFAPVPQVETATVVGTIGSSGAGNATVVVTSGLMSSSPK